MKIRLEAMPNKKKSKAEDNEDESPEPIDITDKMMEEPKFTKFKSTINLAEIDYGWDKIFKGSKRYHGNSYKMRDFENKLNSYF